MSVSKTPNPEKGARYLGQLDQALCSANWNEISELARKVDKHAPDRNCLTLAARAEAQVSSASHRPASASSNPTSIHGLGALIPQLTQAIETARSKYPDDAFVASTCLAEIQWLREAPLEALNALDVTSSPASNGSSAAGSLGWIEVCIVKNSFIRASCQDLSGQHSEARQTYRNAATLTPGYRSPELRRWTERLLARACLYSLQKIPTPSLHDLGLAYLAFRSWGDFWQRAPSSTQSSATSWDIQRRQVWKLYYELLSTFLHRGLVYEPEATAPVLSADELVPESRIAAKRRQRDEIKRIESSYETLLIAETQFPKASQSNQEVEDWTKQFMFNWKVFCGSSWTNAELGPGGKRNVSRNVLDMLYRAATKTFHSTPILRQLFTVHSALGEFDLAMHAFDSYVEIVDKGKARAEKTGKHEIGFDDDDTAMLTAAEAIRLLCRYGDRDQAEKANSIAKSMQKWLDQQRPNSAQSAQTNGDVERASSQPTSSLLSQKTLGATYRSMGISQAHWAQLTYLSETRRSLLTEAKENLQRAQRFDVHNIETAHALALVLAQLREVPSAIDVLRGAIDDRDTSDMVNGNAASAMTIDRERQLLPLWHLLALSLTAEDELEAAAQMCEAAYKQFGDAAVLFGRPNSSTLDVSDKSETATLLGQGVVDHMEGMEKETMLQIKMTQIMLYELMEGAEEAAGLTDELLSLYSRLFGKPAEVAAEIVAKPPPTAASQTPTRFGGALRSITGSIRPRSRSARSRRSSAAGDTLRRRSIVSDKENATPSPGGAAITANGQPVESPIAITVTNEDGVSAEKPHHRHHLPHLPFHGRGHRSGSVHSKSPVPSIPEQQSQEVLKEKEPPIPAQAAVPDTRQPDQPLPDMIHNFSHHDLPAPPGHSDQPPEQDVRLPATHPASASTFAEPQLTSIHERRHKVSVLVQAWLFSAELYIRADNYDDAESLINDARRLTASLELELANSEEGTNARRLYHKGWGSSKSIDNMWADVWSTKAQLALTREQPYEAIEAYEQALSHFPDHSAGIIGLSNLLMDIYEQKLPAEPPQSPLQPSLPSTSSSLIAEAKPASIRAGLSSATPSRRSSAVVEPEPVEPKERKTDPVPAELNRLAARDRAYMLLSDLTKQGVGWDDSEAWLTLARSHELSREISKAKQALWWVVELENNRPIRPWREVTPGGYTL